MDAAELLNGVRFERDNGTFVSVSFPTAIAMTSDDGIGGRWYGSEGREWSIEADTKVDVDDWYFPVIVHRRDVPA